MVTMACETRCRRCGEPFPSDCHPVGRRRRQYRRRPAEGRVAHDVVGRYYDPANGQFLSVDPKVEQTLEAYLYVGDDPVNEIDPSGLKGGPAIGMALAEDQACGWESSHSNTPRCRAFMVHLENYERQLERFDWSDVVTVLGIVAGAAAAATGIGAVIEGVGAAAAIAAGATVSEAAGTAVGLGLTSFGTGVVATYLDQRDCSEGSEASCFGGVLGAIGLGTGAIATGGEVALTMGMMASESLADAASQGFAAFSVMFSITASVVDVVLRIAGVLGRSKR